MARRPRIAIRSRGWSTDGRPRLPRTMRAIWHVALRNATSRAAARILGIPAVDRGPAGSRLTGRVDRDIARPDRLAVTRLVVPPLAPHLKELPFAENLGNGGVDLAESLVELVSRDRSGGGGQEGVVADLVVAAEVAAALNGRAS